MEHFVLLKFAKLFFVMACCYSPTRIQVQYRLGLMQNRVKNRVYFVGILILNIRACQLFSC